MMDADQVKARIKQILADARVGVTFEILRAAVSVPDQADLKVVLNELVDEGKLVLVSEKKKVGNAEIIVTQRYELPAGGAGCG